MSLTCLMFMFSCSIELRESQSSSQSQQWRSSWMRPPRVGSTSTASKMTTAPTSRTSPWISRPHPMWSWKRPPVPVKAWTCWGLWFSPRQWVGAWPRPVTRSLNAHHSDFSSRSTDLLKPSMLHPRDHVGKNGAQWKRPGQLLSKFERGSFKDCRHCHLVSYKSRPRSRTLCSADTVPLFENLLFCTKGIGFPEQFCCWEESNT